MHYQPVLDLREGTVRKVEALARLHDGHSLLMPHAFLPAFDAQALLELYERGLAQSLRDRAAWHSQGIDLDLSINLPGAALCDGRYLEATVRCLAAQTCEPASITLELLETGDIFGSGCAIEQFRRFKDLGVRIAEDDLGSGYSSLTRLREFPFDWAKIDGAILKLPDLDCVEILHVVHMLIRLGHGLDRLVLVEGVEDSDMIASLRTLGADAVQGYGIARPMPAACLPAWIRDELPGVANAMHSTSPRARLARLLIAEDAVRACQQFGLPATPKSRPASTGTTRRRLSAPNDDCLARLRSELDAIDLDNVHGHAAMKLLQAAEDHGVDSTEYKGARHDLALLL